MNTLDMFLNPCKRRMGQGCDACMSDFLFFFFLGGGGGVWGQGEEEEDVINGFFVSFVC